MVASQRCADIVVKCQITVGEHRASIAILPHCLRIVGYENDVRAQHAFAERFGTFAAKSLIADLGHLVDQVDVKIYGEADPESEPRPHAGRVGIDWHSEVVAQFGKRFDIVDRRPYPGSVDPGDEGDVFAAGKGAVKRAAKTEWKRHSGVAGDRAAIRSLGSGEQADQGRLACSVDPEDPEIVARLKNRIDIPQHGLATGTG